MQRVRDGQTHSLDWEGTLNARSSATRLGQFQGSTKALGDDVLKGQHNVRSAAIDAAPGRRINVPALHARQKGNIRVSH
jgi:hypothetical protein